MRRHRCDVLAVDQPWSHPSAGSGGGLLAQLANHAVGQELTVATVGLPAVRLLRPPATRWNASQYWATHHICITLWL